MIPSGKRSPHFNFPEYFIDSAVEPSLAKIQRSLEDPAITDIVLNFEKCQWFEILPLARLFALLCCRPSAVELHVLGPYPGVLSFLYDHLSSLEKKFAATLSHSQEKIDLERRILRHRGWLPERRREAGAFLLAWGAFDLLNDQHPRCRWYLSRDRRVELDELREAYYYKYAANAHAGSPLSARIWPFLRVHPNEQHEILTRVNGEEILAGPLQAHLRARILQSGSAANIFFFEPFDNVFQHAYLTPNPQAGAILSMRVISWLFEGENLKPAARRMLEKLPRWQNTYLRQNGQIPLMEIVVADAGVGIPDSLLAGLKEADLKYLRERGFEAGQDMLSELAGRWELIRYAFEKHSTRKASPPAGWRGLSWVKAKLAELGGGMIQVISNGTNYVLADLGCGLEEIPLTDCNGLTARRAIPPLCGTAVRLVLPLRKEAAPIDRLPKWRSSTETAVALPLWSSPNPVVLERLAVEPELGVERQAWAAFLAALGESFAAGHQTHAALDLDGWSMPRGALECFVAEFCERPELHGRLVLINCDRHVTSRLDTISAAEQLSDRHLLLPLFEPELRLYWLGCPPALERALLNAFFDRRFDLHKGQAKDLLAANGPLFRETSKGGLAFAFGVEEVEQVVREGLGHRLEASLHRRQAVHTGRYRLPLSQNSVPTYVEPHQIFADTELAGRLCQHLAALLRRRFRDRLGASQRTRFRVLTATRIGRDIAMWMPENYPRQLFIFSDYHLVRPEKFRLSKLLQGSQVVIVIDIVSAGTLVDQLIEVCARANATVLGILSFIDFSPRSSLGRTRPFLHPDESAIDHLTFWRHPQPLLNPRSRDELVDAETLSLSAAGAADRHESIPSILSPAHGLRLLTDAGILHHGHFELFGRHYEFATNLHRLFSVPSLAHDESLRACESAVLGAKADKPVAIVLYPDLSNCHILQAPLLKRPKIRRALREKRLRFVEARRGLRALGRHYWLTQSEIKELYEWAVARYPAGFTVLVLDDASSSGDTLLALLELARSLKPSEVRAFVLINRMSRSRIDHHKNIEKFYWATSQFSCLIHLNLPAYTRENCPLCRERRELLAEASAAQGSLFRDAISKRVAALDPKFLFDPQDLPTGPLAAPVQDFPRFSWDEPEYLLTGELSGITRAVSVRLALYRGVPLLHILREASQQPSDEVWRVSLIEVARKADRQQASKVKGEILPYIFSCFIQQKPSRAQATLEALRLFPPEVLLNLLPTLVRASLTKTINDELVVELLLLLHRTLSYRHHLGSEVLAIESEIATLFIEFLAHSQDPRRKNLLEQLAAEWQGRKLPQNYSLPSVMRDLDALLHVYRRPEHQVLYRLATYISDGERVWDENLKGAISSAIHIHRLSLVFVRLLQDAKSLLNERLEETVAGIAQQIENLRRLLVRQIQTNRLANRQELVELLEDVKDGLQAVSEEFKQHTPEPVAPLQQELTRFRAAHSGIDLGRLRLETGDLPPGARILIDQGLYTEIVSNLVRNLLHAFDAAQNRIAATLRLAVSGLSTDPRVEILVRCETCGPPGGTLAQGTTTTEQLAERARSYGVEWERRPPTHDVPWEEIWSFGRL